MLALYGTNGLTSEHLEAIIELKELEEIILFFDGDQAGNEAIEKHSKLLNELLPIIITISKVTTPENEDINNLVQLYEPEILNHLIENRVNIFSSIEQVATAGNNLDKSTAQIPTKVNPNFCRKSKKSLYFLLFRTPLPSGF